MAKQPKIRFKGFTEEWKEVGLGEIADKVCAKNMNKSYTETFTNSAEYGIISQMDFFDHAISNSESISGYYIVQNNDFVYNPRISKLAPVGPINRNKLGRTGIVSPLYTVFRPKKINIEYLEVFFLQNSWNRYMKFHGNSGARLDRFSISDETFWEMPVQYPAKDEQNKVAYFLNELTATISNRETELKKLKNIKCALLEKLFPQDGQFIPAIRFKGFEGKWENRRLKDIATRVTRKNIGLESTLPLCISAQLGLVSQTEYYNNVVVGANLANYFLIKKGEFAYNKSAAAEYPMGAVKCLTSLDKGILSTLYIVFALKQGVDADFVQAHYETKPWQDDVKKRVAVGARNHGLLNISPEDFFDSLVIIPENNDEQKKVGQILAKLSQTISLRERQITLLKHSKQALLEQMFVNV